MRASVLHRLDERPEALGAIQLVEGSLRFSGDAHVGDDVEDGFIECQQRLRGSHLLELRRELIETRVQAHADGTVLSPAGFVEALAKLNQGAAASVSCSGAVSRRLSALSFREGRGLTADS